jgi:hypothetical protein
MAKSESDKLEMMIAHGFEEVRERFNAVDKGFDAVDKRFDAVDRRFNAIEGRLATVEEGQNALRSDVRAVLADHSKRITALERRQGSGRRE